jgi:crotonobetainyl-CoA:carnitine CoA-transferase CaiB-like acyl-CoA transferase
MNAPHSPWLAERADALLGGIGEDRLASLPGDPIVRLADDGPAPGSRFAVGEAAAVALGALGATAARIGLERGGPPGQVIGVSTRRAATSLRSFLLQTLDGVPECATPVDDSPMAALYDTRDGRHVFLCNPFPHLIARMLSVLGLERSSRDGIRDAIAGRAALELEEAIATAGASGAMVRTADEWDRHPQGRVVACAGPIELIRIGDAPPESWRPAVRPLSGVRVLDLTRILAGPTCARTLAEHGADVLLVTAGKLDTVRSFTIDTGHGKRATELDLDLPAERSILLRLAESADVFSQGYRSGALSRHGLSALDLARLRPGIVYVSTNCYGHDGPWAGRRGFDQLASSVTGISTLQGAPTGRPALLPNVANDYITGYLGALGAMAALRRRSVEGGSWHVRVSLCQTAHWLRNFAPLRDAASCPEFAAPGDWFAETTTPYGRLRHLAPVVQMGGTPAAWASPPVPLNHDRAGWAQTPA